MSPVFTFLLLPQPTKITRAQNAHLSSSNQDWLKERTLSTFQVQATPKRRKPFHLLCWSQSGMAIPEARPLPPASGLLDTASFVATVDSFFTNRFAITAKGADVLTYHHFQSDPNKNLCCPDSHLLPLKCIREYFWVPAIYATGFCPRDTEMPKTHPYSWGRTWKG